VGPIDAWKLIRDDWKAQRDLERRRRQFIDLKKSPLSYPVLEAMVAAAVKQNPGFYSELTFADGSKWEFGVREHRPLRPAPHEGERF
jgi:hypothetical protein